MDRKFVMLILQRMLIQCNRVCGAGEQVRSVICRAQHTMPNAISDILPSQRCDAEDKPTSRQPCNNGPCGGLEWVVSRWSGVCVYIESTSNK